MSTGNRGLAAIKTFNEKVAAKYGAYPSERRYPTMEEEMTESMRLQEQRKFRQMIMKLEADNWLINGKPILL